MHSVGSRYKQAGGELVSLDRYAGIEDQLTCRESYFNPLQHGQEDIATRHDHSQEIFYSLLSLPRREQKYAVYRFGCPAGKKKCRAVRAAFPSLPCACEKPGVYDKTAVSEKLPTEKTAIIKWPRGDFGLCSLGRKGERFFGERIRQAGLGLLRNEKKNHPPYGVIMLLLPVSAP